MKAYETNPFTQGDEDRRQLWDMLVLRDIDAFIAKDFSMVEDDFIAETFTGIDARRSFNPDRWVLNFPSLEAYRKEWLKQAEAFSKKAFEDDPREAIFSATTMRDIEIVSNRAILHKKFDGKIKKKDGRHEILNWQTIYQCQKEAGTWKITGFVGYLPNPSTQEGFELATSDTSPAKIVPAAASQHTTAGPYSPVLEVSGNKWVVISGQVPIDKQGKVIGETIEEQTRFTLENCKQQLQTAGIGLADVFKVNVFLTNLNLWPRFNEVYASIMPKPFPVRTAVQTPLLYNFLVEIEMWGIKN